LLQQLHAGEIEEEGSGGAVRHVVVASLGKEKLTADLRG
jgi:hypothetical protein